MSVNIYDEALLCKLRSWTKATEIQIFGPDETNRIFQVVADKTNDSPIKLPMICLTRNAGFTITNINKKPLSFDGIKVEQTETSGTALNAIPIRINYNLEIYTRYLKEADLFARNLIFNIVNYPKITLNISYNGYDIEHVATLRVDSQVFDMSNKKRLDVDQLTILSLGLNIDDAYLWDIRTRNNLDISTGDLEIHIQDTDDSFIIEKVN